MFFTPAFRQLIADLETQFEQHQRKQQHLHETEVRMMQHSRKNLDSAHRSEELAQPEQMA